MADFNEPKEKAEERIDRQDGNPSPENISLTDKGSTQKPVRVKRHLIRPAWLRRTLKTFLCILVVILLLPVLLYLPPVQDFAV